MTAQHRSSPDGGGGAGGAARGRDWAEEDRAHQHARLDDFIGPMLPIAIIFEAAYVAAALLFRSVSFTGGAVAVAVYIAALVRARRILARGDVARAALVTGWALLAMVAIGAPFLHFLVSALVVIAIAGVALVLPYVSEGQLRTYVAGTLGVVAEAVVFGVLLSPVFDEPPEAIARSIVAAAILAAVGLTLRLLLADSVRAHGLLAEARRALADAERAAKEKDAFLVAAVHDLRTPVSTLLLQAEALQRRPGADEDLRAGVARVGRQANRLTRLIERLLDASQIAAGSFQVGDEAVDLTAAVRAAIAAVSAVEGAAGASRIEVEAPDHAIVRGDRIRIEQIVGHLLSNARKFGGASPIRVSVEEQDGGVVLRVADGGIGVAVEDRARIFEAYGRTEATKDHPGVGLGLWLVRETARAMGATVALEETRGGGATFVVVFRSGA